MHHRKRLVGTFWLTSALALVVVASPRTSQLAPPRPDCPRHDPALIPDRSPAYLAAPTATDPAFPVNALCAEDEEQDRADAWDEPRVGFAPLGSYREATKRRSIALRSIPPSYPLRC